MSDKLLPCPQCGSDVSRDDPDWGSVSEYYGISDQSVWISCSGENQLHCPVSIDISIDSHLIGEQSDIVESIAIEAWNTMAKRLSKK